MAGADTVEAWLARLPPADRATAHAVTDARLLAWELGLATLVLVCVLVSLGGLMGRMRRAIEAARPGPWLASAACAGVLATVAVLAGGVIDGFTVWRLDLARGAATGLAAHIAQSLAGAPANVCLAVFLAVPLYALMRVAPRAWPWIAGTGILGLILAVVWLPYALASGPPLPEAPAGAVRDGVARLVADAGLPSHPILASRDPDFDTDVTGAFGQARVVLGPKLLAGPPAEARGWVGHVMSHYLHDDLLVVCLINGLVAVGCLLAIQALAAPLARIAGARQAVTSADPETMPAAAVIAALALVAATLAGNGYLRWANVRADQYSLDHAREPDGLAAAMERFWDHASVDPNPLEEALFYSHPPLSQRLAHAMAWKAAHPGEGAVL